MRISKLFAFIIVVIGTVCSSSDISRVLQAAGAGGPLTQEEKNIRENPLQRSSALMKKVFAAQD